MISNGSGNRRIRPRLEGLSACARAICADRSWRAAETRAQEAQQTQRLAREIGAAKKRGEA
jgi:hypothetical protein